MKEVSRSTFAASSTDMQQMESSTTSNHPPRNLFGFSKIPFCNFGRFLTIFQLKIMHILSLPQMIPQPLLHGDQLHCLCDHKIFIKSQSDTAQLLDARHSQVSPSCSTASRNSSASSTSTVDKERTRNGPAVVYDTSLRLKNVSTLVCVSCTCDAFALVEGLRFQPRAGSWSSRTMQVEYAK